MRHALQSCAHRLRNARLADPGFSADEYDLAESLHGGIPAFQDQRNVALATDERRRPCRRQSRCSARIRAALIYSFFVEYSVAGLTAAAAKN
jgi:hypothetical protein